MSLLRKVRTLVGAWVHKPFMPRPERVDLDEPGAPVKPAVRRGRPSSAAREPLVVDQERVADLIARQNDETGS